MPEPAPSLEFLALQAVVAGRYTLEQEIGRGGMGIVFLAQDAALDRPVAIKLLPPHLAATPALRARFLQEARTAAQLFHPHIVPIHAVEEQGALVFFVMAFVPGQTLGERVRQEGPMDAAAVTRLVQEVAWALGYAHQRGVVHRDIKPENILLERGTGRALVTDFGIARVSETTPATPTGDVLGTARYMSPEQSAGETVDGRSDLYSLGVTAFFAFTGRFPFEAESAAGLLTAHLSIPAPPVASLRPGAPRALSQAIDRCLAKSPEARFAGGEALAAALSRETLPAIPETLRRLHHESSALAMDLVGYGTLAGIAGLSQVLTADFMGFGRVYTIGIALVLASLGAVRGIQLSRLIRNAVREGWSAEDFEAAVQREARAEPDPAPRPSRARSTALYLAGVGALLLFWLGPKQWGLESAGAPLGVLIELLALLLPVGLGRWFGGTLEAPADGKPGLLSRLWFRKARWLFRLGHRWLQRRPPAAVPSAQPTAVYLADAAKALLLALPPESRKHLGEVEEVIGRLSVDAVALRRRQAELSDALAEIGDPSDSARRAVRTELELERARVSDHLTEVISALDTVRLDLLRLRVGTATAADLTGNIEAARRVGERIDQGLKKVSGKR